MKKVIVFLLACLMMSGCAYCKRCQDNKGGQIKEDMQKTFGNKEANNMK